MSKLVIAILLEGGDAAGRGGSFVRKWRKELRKERRLRRPTRRKKEKVQGRAKAMLAWAKGWFDSG
jgi:hypothetical protein